MVQHKKPIITALILFALAAVVLSLFTASQKVVEFQAASGVIEKVDGVTSAMLDGSGKHYITLPSRGYMETIHIKTSSSDGFSLDLISDDVRFAQEQQLTFDEKSEYCHKNAETGFLDCNRIIINPDQLKRYRIEGNAKAIQSIDFSLIKEKRVVAMPKKTEQLQAVGFLILIMIPIIWLTHRWKVLSQWLIVATSVSVLGLVNWEFSIALLLVLLATFALNVVYVRGGKAKWFFFSSLLLSFSFLLLFKYGQEILQTIFVDLGRFGLALPLGISYFVIRVIDTQLKWYRKEIKDISLREYLCFVIFPATIPAGPIDTIDNFHKNRLEKITSNDVAMGLGRIGLGIFKKLVIADFLIFNQLYAGDGSLFYDVSMNIDTVDYGTLLCLLLGNFLFAYIDFSAYSDMAIGLSRLFGYKMVENFNLPIFANSIREYWRRWHLSLSMWCMRNIYFPLMVKTRNPYMPLYVVMAAVGLWHMLNLSWFTWSIHHASCLAFYAYYDGKLKKKLKLPKVPKFITHPLGIIATVFVVSLGHSFVVYADYHYAVTAYFTMLGLK